MTTPREYFKALKILFYALIAGLVFYAITATGIQKMELTSPVTIHFSNIVMPILLFIVMACIILSRVLFQRRLIEIKEKRSLQDRLTGYRGAMILRWALLEAPAFLLLTAYLLTGQQLYLALTLIILVRFITSRPTCQRTIEELTLTPTEAGALRDEEKPF